MNATKQIEIVKTKNAKHSFGDRSCAVYYPAQYAVIVNGATVATITCDSKKYYDVPSWTLWVEANAIVADHPKRVTWSSKKFLVDYAMRRWSADA